MLTVKSDDVIGRNKTYEAIVKGFPISDPGIPESFKVMVKEFQSLGLDVKILTEEKQEVSVSELSRDEDVAPFVVKDKELPQDIEIDYGDTPTETDEEELETPASQEDLFEDFDEDSLFDDFE